MSKIQNNRLLLSRFPANKYCIAIVLLGLALGAIAYAGPTATLSPDQPKGWFSNGSNVQNYEISVDTTVKHSGRASARIKSIAATPKEGFGGFMQVFAADVYHGKRIRMSAWLKSENADALQLWFRLDGAKSMLGFDNMDSRAVKGTSDWKKFELTLDVPTNTINIAFGAFLIGSGQGWVDDFQFEIVGQEVPLTNMLTPEQMKEESERQITKQRAQPANLNFEEGVLTPAEARARLAQETANARATTRWLAANAIPLNTVEARHGFADMQPLKKVIGNARIVSLGEATHGTREFFQLKHRLLEFLATEKGFTIFSIEANMPEAYRLNDYVLNGKGDPAALIKGMYFWTWSTEEVLDMVQWMREFNKSGKGRVEFTGFDMQTPDVAAGIVSDFIASVDQDYTATFRRGIDLIKKSGPGAPFGIATAKFPVKDSASKRVRFSGYIKTEDVADGFAGLWWRVDGAAGVLAFDNMQDRGVVGTTDWKRYDIELPVAADAKNINFGAILTGSGTAWFDGLSVQLDGTPYMDQTDFDLDFESSVPRGFYTGGNGYRVELDSQTFHDGKQSLRMKRSGSANEATGGDTKLASSAWKEIVQHLESSRETYAKKGRTAHDVEWAIQNARVVLQSMQMQANEVSRDQSMADNIKWILDQNPGAKIVLWAHNGHVATGGEFGFDPMGASLRKMFGTQMVVFGFAFNQGSFQAMEMPFPSKKGLRNFNIDPAPEGSMDAILASAGLKIAAIDLRRLPKQGGVADWFKEPRATRSIGAGYAEASAADFLFKQLSPKLYDALLFVEKTTAAKPLPVK